MKKFLMVLCAVMMVFGMVGSANAITFTLDSYNVTLHESGPGLELYETDLLVTPMTTLDLDVGGVNTFDLFALGTNENNIDTDDLLTRDISVAFDFSSPDVETVGHGLSTGMVIFGASGGVVIWDNPIQLAFGTTGLFTIDLENASFPLGSSTNIGATLTYVSADSAVPVPEPTTILLLGSGLLGLVGYNRKRFSKKS